jgi:hypothetical protein
MYASEDATGASGGGICGQKEAFGVCTMQNSFFLTENTQCATWPSGTTKRWPIAVSALYHSGEP